MIRHIDLGIVTPQEGLATWEYCDQLTPNDIIVITWMADRDHFFPSNFKDLNDSFPLNKIPLLSNVSRLIAEPECDHFYINKNNPFFIVHVPFSKKIGPIYRRIMASCSEQIRKKGVKSYYNNHQIYVDILDVKTKIVMSAGYKFQFGDTFGINLYFDKVINPLVNDYADTTLRDNEEQTGMNTLFDTTNLVTDIVAGLEKWLKDTVVTESFTASELTTIETIRLSRNNADWQIKGIR